MQPHAGVVFDFARDPQDEGWVYTIQEGEKAFYIVLEEELSPIKTGF